VLLLLLLLLLWPMPCLPCPLLHNSCGAAATGTGTSSTSRRMSSRQWQVSSVCQRRPAAALRLVVVARRTCPPPLDMCASPTTDLTHRRPAGVLGRVGCCQAAPHDRAWPLQRAGLWLGAVHQRARHCRHHRRPPAAAHATQVCPSSKLKGRLLPSVASRLLCGA
jgi:hypothetical protein